MSRASEPRTLWVTWYPHRRTTSLCEAWGVPLEVIGSRYKGLRKWVGQSIETIKHLRRHRPNIFFVQNPSLGLTVLAMLVRRLFGYYLVVDAHNEGVRPYARSSKFVLWLTRRLLNGADVTIVTNRALIDDVRAAGGNALVLPDRLPTPPRLSANLSGCGLVPAHVMVISTFAPDEPLAAIMSAAATMPETSFAVSGNSQRFTVLGIELPANVRLTGFLPEQQYWDMLANAQVVCDLTLMPDCLVCGAYEALALARPMVLSDNPPTLDLFGEAAVLTTSDSESIARALRCALEQADTLAKSAREVRQRFISSWRIQAAAVREEIYDSATRRKSNRPKELGA